jgi:hypothetical protein
MQKDIVNLREIYGPLFGLKQRDVFIFCRFKLLWITSTVAKSTKPHLKSQVAVFRELRWRRSRGTGEKEGLVIGRISSATEVVLFRKIR